MTSRGRALPAAGADVAPSQLRAVREALECHDRAVGHWWDQLTWRDGPDRRRGRSTAFVTYRDARCARCGSERVELFEQEHGWLLKRSGWYRQSEQYRAAGKLTQPEVHTAQARSYRRGRRRGRKEAQG